ncbi:MAG: DUF6350 family protein [Bifidobacteriaceae bacterium]|jgi:hypothetical protein|nr:DUF6350 family protein [Bifidobacteriaceae bacterium]
MSFWKKTNIIESLKLPFKTTFFCFALTFIIVGFIIISTPPAIDSNTPLWQYIFAQTFRYYFMPFGLTSNINNISLSITPLGLTLIFIILAFISAKQIKNLNLNIIFISFIIQIILSILMSIPNSTISQEAVYKIIFWPSLVLFVGHFSAYLRSQDGIIQTFRYQTQIRKIPNFVRLGIKMSLLTIMFLILFSSLIFTLWSLTSFQEIMALYNLLNPPNISAIAFLLIQIIYVPNLIFLIPAWFTPQGVSFEYSVPYSLWESRQTLSPSVPILATYPTNDSLHLIFIFILIAFLSIALWVAIAIIKMSKKPDYRINFIHEAKNILKIERFNFGNTLSQLYPSELINRILATFFCCGISAIFNFISLNIIFFLSSGVIGAVGSRHFGANDFWQPLEITLSIMLTEVVVLIFWSIGTVIRGQIAKKQLLHK